MDSSSMDDLLRGLVGRIDALDGGGALGPREQGRGPPKRQRQPEPEGGRFTRDNAILREEIASLQYGESTAVDPRERSKTEHLALTTLGNDATVHVASFLGATDIASLGRTCGHFGKRCLMPDGVAC